MHWKGRKSMEAVTLLYKYVSKFFIRLNNNLQTTAIAFPFFQCKWTTINGFCLLYTLTEIHFPFKKKEEFPL